MRVEETLITRSTTTACDEKLKRGKERVEKAGLPWEKRKWRGTKPEGGGETTPKTNVFVSKKKVKTGGGSHVGKKSTKNEKEL